MEVYEKQTSDQIVPKALVMNSRYKNGNDNGFKFKMSGNNGSRNLKVDM